MDLPELPRLSKYLRQKNPLYDVIQDVRDGIRTAREEIHSIASALGPGETAEVAPAPSVSSSKGGVNTDSGEKIATGCLPCALGHFSTSSGLLNEAIRFKGEGMTSNEVLDRIAAALEQQNALEREDLSPVKIQDLPEWQRPIADEALSQSQRLRHRLEAIQSIDELEQIAADTKRYYIKLNRQWYKGRFGYLGEKKADAIAQRVGESG